MFNKVFISPSVQSDNIGVNGYGTEAQKMRDIANMIGYYLLKGGVNYDISIDGVTLQQAIQQSNRSRTDLHIALHSNAGTKTARGCEIYCMKNGGAGEQLAKMVYKHIQEIAPTKGRGIKDGAHLLEINSTEKPAILIEYIFHSNAEDVIFFDSHIERFAIATVNGILEYYDLPALKQYEVPTPDPAQTVPEAAPAWKLEGVTKLHEYGFISDLEYWKEHIEDSIPAWAAFLLFQRIYEKIAGGDK